MLRTQPHVWNTGDLLCHTTCCNRCAFDKGCAGCESVLTDVVVVRLHGVHLTWHNSGGSHIAVVRPCIRPGEREDERLASSRCRTCSLHLARSTVVLVRVRADAGAGAGAGSVFSVARCLASASNLFCITSIGTQGAEVKAYALACTGPTAAARVRGGMQSTFEGTNHAIMAAQMQHAC